MKNTQCALKWLALIVLLLTCDVFIFYIGMYAQKTLHPQTITTNYIYLPSDIDQAKGTLITFLDSLYHKDYTKAASIYGGDYAALKDWNPTVNATNTALLWQRGCEQNGLQCLEIRNIAFDLQPSSNTYSFHLWFNDPIKTSDFALPNGTSIFSFVVKKNADNTFTVETMPIYQQ